MEAFGLSSLLRTADVVFVEVADGVEVRDSESESFEGARESRRLGGELAASRRGMTMSTC